MSAKGCSFGRSRKEAVRRKAIGFQRTESVEEKTGQ